MAKLSPTNAENSINAIAKPASSPGETGQEDGLVGAERILERDRFEATARLLDMVFTGSDVSKIVRNICWRNNRLFLSESTAQQPSASP